MEFFSIIMIGFGLAMDAFSVSVASGAVYKRFNIAHAFRMAFFFGAFQAIMPILGWLAGSTVSGYIEAVDHWIAFIILLVIGGKMIFEAFKLENAENRSPEMSLTTLLTLSIATSIDALAVGITLSLLTKHVFIAVSIIGIITFILCYAGVYIGKHFGHIFEKHIEVAGGIILILIGLKILLAHTTGIEVF